MVNVVAGPELQSVMVRRDAECEGATCLNVVPSVDVVELPIEIQVAISVVQDGSVAVRDF